MRAALAGLQDWGPPDLIVSSPMTRALQSACIVGTSLKVQVEVEFDLYEWVPDLSFSLKGGNIVETHHKEFLANRGEWPVGGERLWEPLSRVRRRVLNALQKYEAVPRLLVVCHGIVMCSLTDVWEIQPAETLRFVMPNVA